VKDVDVVIIAIPLSAMSQLPKDLFDCTPEDVTIIESSNYFPYRDRKVPEIESGEVEAGTGPIWLFIGSSGTSS
jgi:predicted dinucleotide-binding enzyme